ncbi:MAG: redox-regulated ATPase YchF [Candidatus Liptonbacteria bacterium]|nr:redox-regulated ATPase YchF [Candidatus Liptonbacteria bacterium]
MKLSIGIVGLPNVGKSTLFRLLTKQAVNIANYPFATIDPNVGIVPVPDERLGKLTQLSKSKKTLPAVVEFYDIAGLVRGAYKGEGLGNQFLSHIRETQAVIVVLRVFPSPEIIHVENSVDPLRDMEIVNTELVLKDLESVTKFCAKSEAEARTGAKEARQEYEALVKLKACLERGDLPHARPEIMALIRANKRISELNLLTAKAQLYLLNGSETDVPAVLKERIKALQADFVVVDLAETADVGLLIRKSYEILGLISFFTTGEDETRAWTSVRGALAPEAAGEIHSDFEEKFIRAEVIEWEKLVEAGGWSAAKAKGWLRLEGKEYAVKDGDVMVIRHG